MTINIDNEYWLHNHTTCLQDMVSKVDINNDGIIDICEFIRMMSLQQNPLITPESQLEDIFRIFDKDGSGFITRVYYILKLSKVIQSLCRILIINKLIWYLFKVVTKNINHLHRKCCLSLPSCSDIQTVILLLTLVDIVKKC